MNEANINPEILEIFKQEAIKHTTKTINLILDLHKKKDIKNTLSEIKGEIHTLKGDARMMGFKHISDAAHKIEDITSSISNNIKKIDQEQTKNILKIIDIIEDAVKKLPEIVDINLNNFDFKQEKKTSDEIDEIKEYDKIELFDMEETEVKIEDTEKNTILSSNAIVEKHKYMNININKIEELINASSSFTGYYSRFEFILNKLNEINAYLINAKIDEKTKKQMDYIINDFSHELAFFDLTSKHFQEDVNRLKLVPLSSIFDLFPRLVYDVAESTKKDVNFIIDGKEVELDKIIVEKIKSILIHLLRNAVDHGCETPNERKKNGKPSKGNVVLKAYNNGENVVIEISDDGKGLDIEKIKEKALKKGLLSKIDKDKISDEEAISIIFKPGFSTKKEVGSFSGRGVGMDVVAGSLKELNGEIKVNTIKNKGTTFTIILPLISSFLPITIFSLGEKIYGFPSSFIHSVIRIKKDDINKSGNNREIILYENLEIPLMDLNNFLCFDEYTDKEQYKNIIIINNQEEIIAFSVTEIFTEKKMHIKKLTGLYSKCKIIIGSILGYNKAIPIFNVPELILKIKENKSSTIKLARSKKTIKTSWQKNILLVEDSPVTREFEKKVLINQNFNVYEAANGKEALKLLEKQDFDLIITDIEMPIMNGIKFIKILKDNEKFSNIPIIVISTYNDKKDELFKMGINFFIDKSNFEKSYLIKILNKIDL